MTLPLVSVILSAYNAEKYVATAIQSILNQSYTNFELLIIDDGSTDGSLELIRSFDDKRIRVILNEKNKGLVASLNIGIENCKGTYIARMDADDESMPDRLKKQVEYMESNPTVGVLGTGVVVFDDSAYKIQIYLPSHDGLLTLLFFNSCMCHPSVMIRKNLFIENNIRYDEAYKNAEDYDMWTKLARLTKLANLQEPLLKYRIHERQLTKAQKNEVISSAELVRKRQLDLLRINPTTSEMELHNILGNSGTVRNIEKLLDMEKWLIKLIDSNTVYRVVSPTVFNSYLTDIWLDICAKSGLRLKAFSIATQSALTKNLNLISGKGIRFFIKTLILSK